MGIVPVEGEVEGRRSLRPIPPQFELARLPVLAEVERVDWMVQGVVPEVGALMNP